jgi:hypothetical protein
MQDIGVSEYDAELFPKEGEFSQNTYTKTVAEVHRVLRTKGWTLSGEHYSNGTWYLNYEREGIILHLEVE